MFEPIPVVLAQDGEPVADKPPKFSGSDPTTNDQPGTTELQEQDGANKLQPNTSKKSGG